MSDYELTWITDEVAVGRAPMSYGDLDKIREGGIGAIVNLCAEYCDLHEIEENSGFDVYYFPIPDQYAPDIEELEKALDWLEATISKGKKVLVHCRFGIGRTGTFVSAYLIRKEACSVKDASKKMKGSHSCPETHSQWRLLRKYKKKLKKETESK